MKKIGLFILFLLFLPGCMGPVQLNERAIVQAAAIDTAAEGYLLTLQLFDPESASGDATSGGKILSCEGRTVYEAVRQASMRSGQELFFGHTKLIVLGEDVAKNGISEAVSYFNGQTGSRPNIDILLAAGKAADLFEQPLDSTILPVLSTRMLLEDYRDNGRLVRTQLRGLAGSLEDPAAGAYLPIAARTGSGSDGIGIVGTALLCEDTLSGLMTPEETRGLLWILNEMGKTGLSVEEGEQIALFQVVSANTRIKTDLQQGSPKLQLTVTCTLSIEEESAAAGGEPLSARIERYEEELTRQIKSSVDAAIKKLQTFRCDAAGFCDRFRQRYPSWWKENGKRWGEYFSAADHEITVTCRIARGGSALE